MTENVFIPQLGTGIYSIADVSRLLKIPYGKARRWFNEFWDKRFSKEMEFTYAFRDNNNTVVLSFYSLIEFYVFYRLRENGYSAKKIRDAHIAMGQMLHNKYPFATSSLLLHGKRLFFSYENSILTADRSFQLGIERFIVPFAKKIDFNGDSMALRYWPLGKGRSIVIDPKVQFGKPIIFGTRISPDIVYDLYKSGETRISLVSLFDLTKQQVNDAIYYCKYLAA